MICAAALAVAETPLEITRAVNVPAGDLMDALESLARQCGVDVIYPGGLLKGRKTQGVNGTLEPVDAFKRLLEGAPLVLSEEGGALLITQAARAPQRTTAQSPADPLPEVQIEAWRETAEAADPNDQAIQTARSISAKWARHRLYINLAGCHLSLNEPDSCDGLRNDIKSILLQLGARDLEVTNTQVTFSVLVPAASADQPATNSQIVAARWDKVTLEADSIHWYSKGVSGALLPQLSSRILPLFTTRNLMQSSCCVSVEVLRPVSDRLSSGSLQSMGGGPPKPTPNLPRKSLFTRHSVADGRCSYPQIIVARGVSL